MTIMDTPIVTTVSARGLADGQETDRAPRVDDRGVVEAERREDGLSARARIVRNLSALGIGQIFTWGSSAGLAILLPQQLGDQHLGKLATAASLTDICGLLASLGVTGYLVKEVARRELGARSEVLNALVMRVPMAIMASLVAVSAAVLLGYDTLTSQLVYLLCLNIVFSALTTVLDAALHGMQQMRPAATIGALSKGLHFGLVALLLYQGYGVVGVLIAQNVAAAASLVAYLYVLMHQRVLGGRLDLRTWRVILVGSLPFFTWQAAHMLYGQVDVILLSQFTRDAVVGWYGAAYRIVSIPVFVPTIIAAAVYPALSKSAQHDPREHRLIAQRSVRAVLLLTIPIAVGTMLIAQPMIGFLRYPVEFQNSVPLIIILASHMPLVGATVILGLVLIAQDLQRPWALTSLAAAVINPGLNLLLIPYFHRVFDNGAIGAACATLLTEVFITVVALWLLRGAVLDWTDLAFTLRCLAAASLMAGAVWLTLDLFLPLTVAIGALVYFAASWLVGALSPREIRVLVSYAARQRAAPSADEIER